MTHPHHHYPGCGHIPVTQPPNPGNTSNPSVTIDGGVVWLLILGIMIIIGYTMLKKKI